MGRVCNDNEMDFLLLIRCSIFDAAAAAVCIPCITFVVHNLNSIQKYLARLHNYSNKMSDAVALNGGRNEEELRDDADDTNSTSTIMLMLSQQELEGDGEISDVTERRDTAVPCWLAVTKFLALLGLMYGPIFGFGLAFTITNPTLAWLVGAACLSVSLGTISWMMWPSFVGADANPHVATSLFYFYKVASFWCSWASLFLAASFSTGCLQCMRLVMPAWMSRLAGCGRHWSFWTCNLLSVLAFM
jgi:hypothetical protein